MHGSLVMAKVERDAEREERITMEIVRECPSEGTGGNCAAPDGRH